MLLQDSAGNKSFTHTIAYIGAALTLLKYGLSGLVIFGYEIPPFSGMEFGAAIGSLGTIYVLRRKGNQDVSGDSKK